VAIIVELTLTAELNLEALERRWSREHGHETPNPLRLEITHLAELLSVTPKIGTIVRSTARPPSVQYRWITRTGWRVYYTYAADQDFVMIDAIWSGRRRPRTRR
jgi:plasmid stabilization system protein ParE